MNRKEEIVCPKCGHKGSYYVAIWGTGKITNETGLNLPQAYIVNIDEKEYAECPNCKFKTEFHQEFWRSNGGSKGDGA